MYFLKLGEGEEITQKLTIVLLWFYCRSSSSLVCLLILEANHKAKRGEKWENKQRNPAKEPCTTDLYLSKQWQLSLTTHSYAFHHCSIGGWLTAKHWALMCQVLSVTKESGELQGKEAANVERHCKELTNYSEAKVTYQYLDWRFLPQPAEKILWKHLLHLPLALLQIQHTIASSSLQDFPWQSSLAIEWTDEIISLVHPNGLSG